MRTGLFLLASCIALTGCKTLPVTASFPNIPPVLEEKCPNLSEAPEGAKLSELMITVITNYTKYYECSRKNQGWQEWYRDNKEIHNKATGAK